MSAALANMVDGPSFSKGILRHKSGIGDFPPPFKSFALDDRPCEETGFFANVPSEHWPLLLLTQIREKVHQTKITTLALVIVAIL